MKHRITQLAVSLVIVSLSSVVHSEELSQPAYDVVVETNIMVEMRDGIRLRTEIYRPDAPGAFPVILIISPYDDTKSGAKEFAKRGYVYIYQYARGRLGSEGFFYPYVTEGEDAFDALQWISSQPWCNGMAGMRGGSAEASCQFAVGAIGHPVLKTIVPWFPVTDAYNVFFRQGAYRLISSHWAATMYAPYGLENKHSVARFDSINKSIPLIDQDKIIGWPIPLMRDMLAHPAYDAFWRQISIGDKLRAIKIPTYMISGWFDSLLPGVLKAYAIMTGPDVSPSQKGNKRLVLGPWSHTANNTGIQGEMDFGKDGIVLLKDRNHERSALHWFDYYLKGKPVYDIDSPPVRIFVMGKNEWRDENEWPVKRTRFEKYYFHSKGDANSLRGDGAISTRLPQQEPADKFIYDPLNPVPSYHDTSYYSRKGMNAMLGPIDHRRMAEREDVLVFTSERLHNDIEVTGPVKVILYASSSAINTDFTANLCDVYPDGRSMRLCEGIIRATHRDGPKKLSFIEPGEVYKYQIDLLATSNLFKNGHQIRVEISSSNFPHYDRNLNTALNNAWATETVQAEQTIYHNEKYPSYILLPVIPELR
ncbi:CocE/NonD family hydrolase [candidate division KSB1 bacterium]